MIFISHTHADKPVVEPIAIALREIFGEESVFYDSWAIKPGDGIIEKINEGLSSPKFVFFFVSERSLQSEMVKLEWQNSLLKATKGECKIVPVRVDGSNMPPLLAQNLYIDMYTQGITVAKQQIIGVIQGTKGFSPSHESFSNLTWHVTQDLGTEIIIKVVASHLMEPVPSFVVLLNNTQSEVNVSLVNNGVTQGGYTEGVIISGQQVNAFAIAPLGGAVTPKHPLEIKVEALGGSRINLRGVLHKSSAEEYTALPVTQGY